jgi:ATP-independent RNA helicase DbpA
LIEQEGEQLTNGIIFCNRKTDVDIVHKSLKKHGYNSQCIHGDLGQIQRTKTLDGFRDGSVRLLVASDVAARGLDIPSVSHVFNYDVPNNAEDYVHRIGRTGRAGSSGLAYSLFSDKESYKVGLLEDYLDTAIVPQALPSLAVLTNERPQAKMATIQIDGGKKQKVRPGDILGALTGDNGIQGSQVGKISVLDNKAYVAVNKSSLKLALRKLAKGKMKGRTFKVRHLVV